MIVQHLWKNPGKYVSTWKGYLEFVLFSSAELVRSLTVNATAFENGM